MGNSLVLPARTPATFCARFPPCRAGTRPSRSTSGVPGRMSPFSPPAYGRHILSWGYSWKPCSRSSRLSRLYRFHTSRLDQTWWWTLLPRRRVLFPPRIRPDRSRPQTPFSRLHLSRPDQTWRWTLLLRRRIQIPPPSPQTPSRITTPPSSPS